MVYGTFRETKIYAAIIININVYIQREKKKNTFRTYLYYTECVCLTDTTVVELEFMEQTYKGNVHFYWLLLLPRFLPPVLLVLPVL